MDYGYEEYLDITPDQILQKVTQQQIFEFVLKEPFKFGYHKYKSPFRTHSNPNKGTCRFEQREDGTILFVDFGDSRTHRTCFRMVMDSFQPSITLDEAVKVIVSHFNLSKDPLDYKPVSTINLPQSYVKSDQPSDIIITYDPIPLEKRHKLYISQFLILPEHLQEDNVYATNKFYIQKPGYPRKTINVFTLCFAIDFIDKVKLYQPYSKDYKWITNIDEDIIGNFDNLDETGNEVLICKSWKDHRIIRNILFLKNVIYFQNEGMIPSMYILENLSKRFKLITIFFDNDETGIKAALKLQAIFNNIRIASCRIIYIPQDTGYKDTGSVVSKEGRTDTVKLLKQIGLWNTI